MEFTVKIISRLLGLAVITSLILAINGYRGGDFKMPDFATTMTDYMSSKQKSYVTAATVDRTLDCLAMNIYREAGHEPFEGKVAVAQVTINRVDSPSFPKDVCSVVYEKNKIMSKVVCQFSWYCNGVLPKPNTEAYNESREVAKKVLLEGFRLPGLKTALFYHAVYVKPNWPYAKLTTIGQHIFYEPKGRNS